MSAHFIDSHETMQRASAGRETNPRLMENCQEKVRDNKKIFKKNQHRDSHMFCHIYTSLFEKDELFRFEATHATVQP